MRESDNLKAYVATWNIAAVNNNPFEYWVTYPDAVYNEFMLRVEQIIADEEGGRGSESSELEVRQIFTEGMFSDLIEELKVRDITGVELLRIRWAQDLSKRKAIRGFLKDKALGEKRLTSMPDRITNTINLIDGTKITRPTVINAYDRTSLQSVSEWWTEWKHFMFHTLVTIFCPKTTGAKPQPQFVCSLIEPIRRSKYPAITPEEEAMGSSLQILCLAILDSIFIYIANQAAQSSWEKIRSNLCTALIKEKEQQVCRIVAQAYSDRDVIFIQEAAVALVRKASLHPELSGKFAILVPSKLDSKRDQNSLIFVDRARFDAASHIDVTACVAEALGGDFIDAGDLFVVSILGLGGRRWLLASFHGDSNGLSTQPVVSALHRAHQMTFKDHVLLAGIDANTQSHGHDRYHHGVGEFRALLRARRMVSAWDGERDPLIKTTCSARTSLQPQLSKAVPFHKRFSGATVSLKDWLLGYDDQAH